jgi:hypothetical protein
MTLTLMLCHGRGRAVQNGQKALPHHPSGHADDPV